MSDESEDLDRFDLLNGHEPTRPARLHRFPSRPPPLPEPHAGFEDDVFGQADEDGLRMLAALETLTSLEPDFSDDLTAEASVTIVESGFDHASPEEWNAGRAPRQGDWHEQVQSEPGLLLNGYETFLALGEEATVEIVEVDHPLPGADPTAELLQPRPASLAERIAVAAAKRVLP